MNSLGLTLPQASARNIPVHRDNSHAEDDYDSTPSLSNGNKNKTVEFPDYEKSGQRWAERNSTRGFNSLALAIASSSLGLLKVFIDKESPIYKFLSFSKEVTLRTRGHLQYSLYSEDVDDLGYDKRNRPFAAKIGEFACNLEKYVNPIVLPITSLLNENMKEGSSLLFTLANNLWWRARPMVEGINWEDIKSKKLLDNMMSLFNSSVPLEKREKNRVDVVKTVSPLLGSIGYYAMALFAPIKAINKFRGVENKFINFGLATSFVTQHLMYFFKYTMEDLHLSKNENLKGFKESFYLGLSANFMNFLLPVVKMLPIENPILKTMSDSFEDLITTPEYFANRRRIRGKNSLETNQA